MEYTWDFKVVADNFHILLRGVGLTIELWAVAFVLGLALGLLVSMGPLSGSRWLRWRRGRMSKSSATRRC